jgi:polysaccharide pyruvyl transferase WcaK-like protein
MAFHQHQDGPLLNALVDQKLLPKTLLARSTTVTPRSLDHVFDLVRTARLVLPMRLHALILARLAGCPMAALSYDPKVDAAAAMAHVPCVQLDQLPRFEDLAAQWMAEADREADRGVIERIQADASAHGELLRRWI